MNRRQKGFTIVEAVLLIAAAGIITAVGLTFYNSMTKQQSTADDNTSQATTAEQVPAVQSTADIDTATTDLDTLDVEDLDDTSQLDEQQAAF